MKALQMQGKSCPQTLENAKFYQHTLALLT
jgi:hypothetical protein